jgi:hypothetical protein
VPRGRKKRIRGCGEVDIEVSGPQWRLVVENKIDAEEEEGQTEKYAAYYKSFYKPRENLFLVFLSRLGQRPQSPYFTPMSYRDLRQVLESVDPSPETRVFVRHLIQNIYQLEG